MTDEKDEMTEKAVHFVGTYVVSFQHIERTLDFILAGSIKLGSSGLNAIISELSYASKVKCVRSIVNSAHAKNGNDKTEEWIEHFNEVMVSCSNEAEFRNKIVHAAYEWRFVEYGGPALITHARASKSGANIFAAELSEDYCNTELRRIAELAFAVEQIKTQLIHWHDLLFESEMATESSEWPEP